MEATTLTTNEQAAIAAGGILGGMFALFAICGLIWAILLIIGWWKMFTKAGEKGWKSLIPIYNTYIAFKIAGMFPWWPVILTALSIILGIALPSITASVNEGSTSISMTGTNVFGLVLNCVLAIVSLVVSIMWCFKLSKAYKRGVGTAILLIFFPNIMALVLGFGSAKYDKKAKYGE